MVVGVATLALVVFAVVWKRRRAPQDKEPKRNVKKEMGMDNAVSGKNFVVEGEGFSKEEPC